MPFDITDNIRGNFSSKLWRMEQLLAKLGGSMRKKQLEIWKTDKVWNLTISESEAKSQLFCKRKATEEQLTELQAKGKN